MQTANEKKIYDTAFALLDTRVAPFDASTDYGQLGCAATVNIVVEKALGKPIGGGASTEAMYHHLQDRSRFEEVTEPAPGRIII